VGQLTGPGFLLVADACPPLNSDQYYFPMNPEERTDKLNAKLKKQESEIEKLQSNVAENKEATKELKKSLENLESVTKKVEEDKG
jgi:uncharacterized coiled-coil protein SlyX